MEKKPKPRLSEAQRRQLPDQRGQQATDTVGDEMCHNQENYIAVKACSAQSSQVVVYAGTGKKES